jgi:hypothetical protein
VVKHSESDFIPVQLYTMLHCVAQFILWKLFASIVPYPRRMETSMLLLLPLLQQQQNLEKYEKLVCECLNSCHQYIN